MADSTNGARLKKRNKNKKLIASRLPVILVVAMVISIQIQRLRTKAKNGIMCGKLKIEHVGKQKITMSQQ